MCRRSMGISSGLQPLLIIARGLIIGVDDSVGGDSLSVQRLGPSVDRVHIPQLIVLVDAISIQFKHRALESHKFANRIEPVQHTFQKRFLSFQCNESLHFLRSGNRSIFFKLKLKIIATIFFKVTAKSVSSKCQQFHLSDC